MGGETITELTFHEGQNVETMFILNRSQNLTHIKFGKLHILRYAQSEHLRA
jgi:hypothetical protein